MFFLGKIGFDRLDLPGFVLNSHQGISPADTQIACKKKDNNWKVTGHLKTFRR